jgi:glycine cleavage system regulatory protein
MYSMKINIKIPETISLENIEDHLENIANDLNVDITLK